MQLLLIAFNALMNPCPVVAPMKIGVARGKPNRLSIPTKRFPYVLRKTKRPGRVIDRGIVKTLRVRVTEMFVVIILVPFMRV